MAAVRSALPVINVAPFLAGERGDAARKICQQIRHAAATHGFFYVKGHSVPSAVTATAFATLREFFAMPDAEKNKHHVGRNEGFRGYTKMHEQGGYGLDETDARATDPSSPLLEEPEAATDAKEAFHFGQELPRSHKCYNPVLFAPNVYPTPKFEAALGGYQRAVREFSDDMFRIFALSLELPEQHFEAMVHEGMDSLNCLHYPPLPSSEAQGSQMGIGSHTDFECFTLLAQQTDTDTGGLEILQSPSQPWVRMPAIEGAFVVNIGDLLARWSNDKFKSTVHRARNPTEEGHHRYSMAYFRCCNYDTTVSSLDPVGTAKYPPVQAGKHMLDRILQANSHTVEQIN